MLCPLTQAIDRMYDNNYSPGNETLLIDTMKLLKSTGDPWELVFEEQVRVRLLVTNLKVQQSAAVLPDDRSREHT